MSLHSEHVGTKYEPPHFQRCTSEGAPVREVLERSVRATTIGTGEAISETGGPATSESDTGLYALATFLEGAEPLRQALATRRLKGEVLGPEEGAALDLLNAHLDSVLPGPRAEPPEVTQAMMEATRLLAKYGRG